MHQIIYKILKKGMRFMSIDSLLVGKNLKLTAVEKEDVETIASWYRDISFKALRYNISIP
ncbi:GNAT family acetyltransferase [Clostridium botulinum A1 str. CFSAN002368]|nr:GNAT family acetyltransferase [Clostridium botulinum A1 str. CFSAN002368]